MSEPQANEPRNTCGPKASEPSDPCSLLVVTGPPGAGKSTVADLLAARRSPSALVAGDDLFACLREGAIEPWLPASHGQNETVVEAAAAAAGRFARGGIHTVFDGVIGPWFLERFLLATGVDALDYVVLLPPVERCLAGVRTRVGHGFTDEPATRKMHAEFAAAAADVDAGHVLADLPAEPRQVADLVEARAAARALRVERPT